MMGLLGEIFSGAGGVSGTSYRDSMYEEKQSENEKENENEKEKENEKGIRNINE